MHLNSSSSLLCFIEKILRFYLGGPLVYVLNALRNWAKGSLAVPVLFHKFSHMELTRVSSLSIKT